MLSEETLQALRGHMGLLRRPVVIGYDADDPAAQQLVRSLEGLSPLLRTSPGSESTLSVSEEGEAPRIVFAGVPGGHEFTSLVLAILHVGGHPPRDGASDAARIRAIVEQTGRELTFTTYYSQSCLNCPDVVQALNTLAALVPGIRAVPVDGATASEEVNRLGVKAVPAVYLDGELFHSGRATMEEITTKILHTLGAAKSESATEETAELLVIGGGPAGVTGAVYAARKGIEVTLAAERIGGQLLDTVGIENLVTTGPTTGPALTETLNENLHRNGVRIRKGRRARSLRAGATRRWRVEFENGSAVEADSVLLAPGARWRTLGVPGEEEYRNKGVTFCPHCDGPLFKAKRVAVIGGGNSGVEAALDLAGVAGHVTLIEFANSLRADAVLVEALERKENVTILTGRRTTEVLGDGAAVTALRLENHNGGHETTLDVDGVFIQIGLLPNTEWLQGAVALNERGEIPVDERGRTGLAGVLAAGDATDSPYKQITTAVGAGAAAAIAAFEERVTANLV
jgi:alkyl hydroperoxide reductase subunit F